MTTLNTETLSAARRYKIAREVAGLRQGDLAKILGVARTTIGEWEAGRTEPAASKLVMLARATNQPLEWFAEGLIADSVRPKGLEPLTFWLGADSAVDSSFWTPERVDAFSVIVCQDVLDNESHDSGVVA